MPDDCETSDWQLVFEVEQAMRPDDKKLCDSCRGSGQYVPPTSRTSESSPAGVIVVNAACPYCGGSGLSMDAAKQRLMEDIQHRVSKQLFRTVYDEKRIREVAESAIHEAAEKTGVRVAGWDVNTNPGTHTVEVELHVEQPAEFIVLDLKEKNGLLGSD